MDLNTILIILGVLVLIVLIAHAIWSNRREKSQYFNNANTFNRQPILEPEPTVKPDFMQPEQTSVPPPVENIVPAVDNVEVQVEEDLDVSESNQSVDQINIRLPDNEPSSSEQKVYYEYIPESRSRAVNIDDKKQVKLINNENQQTSIDTSSDLKVQLQDSPLKVSPISEPKLQQPIQTEQQAYVEQVQEEPKQEDLDFILLYVVAPENSQFHGTSLAHSLDNLGCVLGKDNIYHRHVDTIASPVIFSVANVNKPGTFNLYTMNEFSTVGVAFFIQIPSSVGNDLVNLRMMIQAAKTLASELGGFVLTDEQQLFDETAEQEYLSRLM